MGHPRPPKSTINVTARIALKTFNGGIQKRMTMCGKQLKVKVLLIREGNMKKSKLINIIQLEIKIRAVEEDINN